MRNFKQYILGRGGCPNMNSVILKSSSKPKGLRFGSSWRNQIYLSSCTCHCQMKSASIFDNRTQNLRSLFVPWNKDTWPTSLSSGALRVKFPLLSICSRSWLAWSRENCIGSFSRSEAMIYSTDEPWTTKKLEFKEIEMHGKALFKITGNAMGILLSSSRKIRDW